jgi:hypothetical protein
VYPPDAPYPVSPFVPYAPFTTYVLLLPNGAASAVRVLVLPQVDVTDQDADCHPASANRQPLTCASLPMRYLLADKGAAMRSRYFINTLGMAYALEASDTNADPATRAQGEAILATFRPDIAAALMC